MRSRFEGPDGKRRLIEAVGEQRLVEHNLDYAQRIVEVAELVEFAAEETLIKQDAADNHVYFLLAGDVSVIVNDRSLARRSAKESIGEMALLDGSAPRSATIKTLTPTVALKVTEPDLVKLLDEFPRMWRSVAKVVSERLRQRATSIRPRNARPRLFIGSSVESLSIARLIELHSKHDPIEVTLWTTGVFGPSSVTLDALTEQAVASDFALFVFGPDDKVTSREKESEAPRDNVIFELGLFIGELGIERTFFMKEHKKDLKIPTDLLGITPISFVSEADMSKALSPACTELRLQMIKLGAR